MAIESKCEGGHDQGRGAVAWVPISRYTVSGSRISRGERGTPLTTSKTTPFTIAVPQAVLDDLRERLARTRFPDQPPGAPWAYGTDLGYLRELVSYWQTRYDWRKHEAELNGFRQFTAPVAGIGVHFLHEEGRGPSPLPLILSHGWPGSVWEFHKIIPMLTDPARFGGDARDAFTVVAPSLPGPARRLGRLRHLAAGRRLSRAPGRHSRESPRAPTRSPASRQADAGGARVPGRSRKMAARGNGLPVDPGHQASDPRLWPHRLARGAGRVDRGEVQDVERLWRRRRAQLLQGRAADERDAVLGHGSDRLVLLALLRPLPRTLAHRRRPAHRGAHGLRRLPERDHPPAALVGGARLQHQALDGDAVGRPLRGPRGAQAPRRGHPRFLPRPEVKEG